MELRNDNIPDLSVIMPCLNEHNAVGSCTDDAVRFIRSHSLTGEVIVVDNGSTDGSADIAREHGAAVIDEPRRGYGRAIRTGMEHASGRVLVISDCDTTYDVFHIDELYYPLARGEYDMMIGDRFAGTMEKGAMPFLHRLGVPFLSWLGRRRYRVKVRDFHCGLRSVTREAAMRCSYTADGMEFATEMIAEAAHKELRIGQSPVKLRRATVGRSSKLRTFSDGMRHIRFMLSGK